MSMRDSKAQRARYDHRRKGSSNAKQGEEGREKEGQKKKWQTSADLPRRKERGDKRRQRQGAGPDNLAVRDFSAVDVVGERSFAQRAFGLQHVVEKSV